MKKTISMLLIGTLATSNLLAMEAGAYCKDGKCYAKRIQPKSIKKKENILTVDISYELDVRMEIEKQLAEGRKPIIVNAGVDENGEYNESYSYFTIPNELNEAKEATPKYFCPDKKTLYCADSQPTEDDCKCV